MLLAIQCDQRLTSLGATHDDRPADLVEVVRMHGLPQIEHDVVRHIDRQAQRTHPRSRQTVTHPIRRRAARLVVMNRTNIETVASDHTMDRIVVIDDHIDVVRLTVLVLKLWRTLFKGGHRIGELRPGGVVELACDAAIREGIAAVGGHIDLKNRLVEMQQVHGIVARLQRLVFLRREAIIAQQYDAVMAVAQTKLTFRSAHAVGDMPIGLAWLNLEITWQHCARQCDDDLLAGLHVRRAADDATWHLIAMLVDVVVFLPDIHMAPVDDLAVLLRFRGGVHHIADDDGTRHVAGVDLLLLKADPHQVTGEFLIGLVLRHGHMLTQPAHIYHWHILTPPSRTVN